MPTAKRFLVFLAVILTFYAVISVQAETVPQNPVDWLAKLEVEVLGQENTRGLQSRLENLEEIVTGRTWSETIVERLTRLDTLLYRNQPHDISLLYKIQALEWVLYKEESSGALYVRLQKVERLIQGETGAGPITKRLENMITQVFPKGSVRGHWVTVPDGQLIKVKLLDELSSNKNKPGDRFRFVAVETVTAHNYVLIPKGSAGTGYLQTVKRPANLGRDASLVLDFNEINALDGTPVKIFYGAKAQDMNRSRQFAVGVSTAGMLAFGPQGILAGLVIKGHETKIPAGTEVYLEVKEPVRIFTLEQ